MASPVAVESPSAYQFDVTAPAVETLAWLYGRAEGSGLTQSRVSATGFTATWRGAVMPPNLAPAKLDVDVQPRDPGSSRVTANVTGDGAPHNAVIRDFAGALGSGMTQPARVPS